MSNPPKDWTEEQIAEMKEKFPQQAERRIPDENPKHWWIGSRERIRNFITGGSMKQETPKVLVIHDTREGDEKLFNIAGGTEEEKAKNFCEKTKLVFIEAKESGTLFGFNPEEFKRWYKDRDVEAAIQEVKDNLTDELRGLYSLYELPVNEL